MEPSEQARFEAFHAATARPLWAYLYRVTGEPATADEVLQESYLRCLLRPRPSSDERGARAYLFRIATNLLRDRWRRERRERSWIEAMLRSRVEPREPARGPADTIDAQTVLSTLSRRERTLVWLAYVEGHTHDEIAEIVGVKKASVRVLLYRARRKLAAKLGSAVPQTTDRLDLKTRRIRAC